jgi:ribonuclease HI
MWFKGNKVWAAVNADGSPRIDGGRVLIKYRQDQEYEYRVNPRNLSPLEGSPPPQTGRPGPPAASGPKEKSKRRAARMPASEQVDIPDNAIRIYTDGASSGNPGPAGIGVLLSHGEHCKEISKYIGKTTNNVAELEAIRAGLQEVKKRGLPVRLFTDSGYAFGLLVLGWKPKKNRKLIADILRLMTTFKDLKLIKVKGHAGDSGNERADHLATAAVKSAGSSS